MLRLDIRQANGDLVEREIDQCLLSHLRELRKRGLFGGALIRELVAVDPNTPPLSMRIAGSDSTGTLVNEFICYD